MESGKNSADLEIWPGVDRVRHLEKQMAFLLDEVSHLRSLVRFLTAAHPEALPVSKTLNSFDFQWDQLPDGKSMLSNAEWRDKVCETICKFSRLPRDWFPGKTVLDAGCGLGRWSWGFGRLGVGSCFSFDVSPAAVERTRAAVAEFGPEFRVEQRNILEPNSVVGFYDLVWCFGVLHHTGNTFCGFQNLAGLVKPGGYLFLMLYGEPRRENPNDFSYYHEMFDMRCRLRNMPFEQRVRLIEEKYGRENLHGYFDAISPPINDLYRWDEIEGWLLDNGFEEVQRTLPDHPNHHLVARRKGGR